MSEEKLIGLVVAPGVTEKLAQSLIDDIPNILSEQDNHQRDWQVDLVVDPLTGFAESVEEIFKKFKIIIIKRMGLCCRNYRLTYVLSSKRTCFRY